MTFGLHLVDGRRTNVEHEAELIGKVLGVELRPFCFYETVLMEDRTTFIFAYRLFTIRNTDKIIFMKDGT